jgi:K+-sensing histidine kinase KdpD
MAVDTLSPSTWWSPPNDTKAGRRETIVMVRWALIIACSYLILFSEGSKAVLGLGPLMIAVFLSSNLVIGRLSPELVATQQFNIAIVVVDTLLIGMSLYFAGQIALIVLCLGVLFLAVAGLRLSAIAAATLGMSLAYMLIVWMTGSESFWRSNMLLRVPFLLCAAIVYAWATEGKRARDAAGSAGASSDAAALAAELATQLDAIRHCQDAVASGTLNVARAALDEITEHNQAMQAKLAALQSKAEAGASATAARNAA